MVSPANHFDRRKMVDCPHQQPIAEMAEAEQQWWLLATPELAAERQGRQSSRVEYGLQ